MMSYTNISKSEHQNAGYEPPKNMLFAAQDISIPIVFDELAHVLTSMTMGFQKDKASNTFELVVIQSLKPDNNAYVAPNGRWLAGYVPSYYRAYPFALQKGEQPNEMLLALADSVIKETCQEGDIPLYEEDDLSPALKQTTEYLVKCLKSRHLTLKMCQQLQEHDLIVEWPIPLNAYGLEEEGVLNGFYRIDIEKLQQLSESALHALNQSGALRVAYAQELSMERIDRLFHLYQIQKKAAQAIKPEEEPDLEQLFDRDDEILSF